MDRAEERAGPEDVGEQALMRGLDTAFPCIFAILPRAERRENSATNSEALSGVAAVSLHHR